jgi:hypothetical protein
MFEGREEFLDEVHRKGDKLDRRRICERKQQMHASKIFEGATRLDSWDNQKRVEFM